MAFYTIELKDICMSIDEYNHSSVDDIITSVWNKIFTTKVEFFDEKYRKKLCCKIIKHYYTREIGAETVGLFKLWVNTKLEEIMPLYNQYYLSSLEKITPFIDTDYTILTKKNTEEKKKTDRGESGNSKSIEQNTSVDTLESNQESSSNSNSDTTNKRSDTPQGTLANLEDNTYLSSADISNYSDSGSTKGKNTDKRNATTNKENNSENSFNLLENVLNNSIGTDNTHIIGKMGSTSYSKLLQEFRETFMNIDMLVIEEFEECFMQLWK